MHESDRLPPKQYERMFDPEPEFLGNRLGVLEQGAASGELTGGKEMYFLAGVELEFNLFKPEAFRAALADKNPELTYADEDSKQRAVENILQVDEIATLEFRRMSAEEAEAERSGIRDYISALMPTNQKEAEKQQAWLADVDNFGPAEFINFHLYKEFSVPTLGDVAMPKGASYDELRQRSDATGWLEFRFGTGTLQTGYYDGNNVSEIRLSPCSPSEMKIRYETVTNRLAEIASEYGGLVSVSGKHLNLSVYERDDAGERMPVIGNAEERQEATVNISSGIAAAFQDKVWLSQANMRPGYMSSKHHTPSFTVGSRRASLRLQEDYVELRIDQMMGTITQGLDWMMAGAISGEAIGVAGLKERGYETTAVNTVYRVTRAEGFNKDTHLGIQRGLENVDLVNGVFHIEEAYNFWDGAWVARDLLGEEQKRTGKDRYAYDVFNETVMSAIKINAEGVPVCDALELARRMEKLRPELQHTLTESWFKGDISASLAVINANLSTVRMHPFEAVAGDFKAANMAPENTYDKIRQSPIAQLAYGEHLDDYLQWIASRKETTYMD